MHMHMQKQGTYPVLDVSLGTQTTYTYECYTSGGTNQFDFAWDSKMQQSWASFGFAQLR